MRLQRYPYRGRASWGEAVVAESDACLCLERDGEPATLWFPEGDIDRARVADESVLTIYPDPTGSLAPLRDHAAFDTDRVVVEVLDGDPVDESPKHFPTWGDTSDLVDLIDVRPEGPGRYVSTAHSDGRRPVVEGSQMLGQAIVAAGRELPDRRVVSAHMVFLRGADARRPLVFELLRPQPGAYVRGAHGPRPPGRALLRRGHAPPRHHGAGDRHPHGGDA